MLRTEGTIYEGSNLHEINASLGGMKFPKENETFLKKYGAGISIGRKAKVNEMNAVLIDLASGAVSYITGHNLVIDVDFTYW